MFKKFLYLCLIISLVACNHSKNKKIEDLLASQNLDEQRFYDQCMQFSHIILVNLKPKNVDQSLITDINKFNDVFHANYSKEILHKKLVETLENTLSEAEIDELLGFYLSPVGKKVTENTQKQLVENKQVDSLDYLDEDEKRVFLYFSMSVASTKFATAFGTLKQELYKTLEPKL